MDQENRTLYVGNLDPSVTEELLLTLFTQIAGPVRSCKIVHSHNNQQQQQDPYAFVEFLSHPAASTALVAMNKRLFLDRELRVNWASSNGGQQPQQGQQQQQQGGGGGGQGSQQQQQGQQNKFSDHHHIFVGDLGPEVEQDQLREAFSPFGEISDVRIVKDALNGGKSKGYGFVYFVRKSDAQTAIERMNGQFLGSRAVRTNWATRKTPGGGGGGGGLGGTGGGTGFDGQTNGKSDATSKKQLNYEEVFNSASAHNFTVYCGGLYNGDDNLIRRTFSPFGRIMEIRYFRDKGYSFIR